MVDVVRDNFSALLPSIEECIQHCDFVAIDTEFTGLHATSKDEVSLFDTINERYAKLKRFAETFIMCQFGLSTFTKDSKDYQKYLVHTFNFYVCPRQHGMIDVRFAFQASNIDFLCEHKFDFNKLFYEGLHYLNSKQEADMMKDGVEMTNQEREEALGLTRVLKLLKRAKKPVLGHNMLCDLALMYHHLFEPLPDTYSQFKIQLHKLFPIIIDTKHLCFAVQRRLSQTKLLEFTSLFDLHEALGSKRGTFHVLYAPETSHAKECQRYNTQHVFHEAGFDAYCVGFVFLRIAHLLAMKGTKSTEAHPIHIRQYFKLVQPFTNRINLIRGPVHYIDLQGNDPHPIRSPWLIVSTPDKSKLTLTMLQKEVNSVMDVRNLSPYSAVVVLSSIKRTEVIMKELEASELCVRKYRWTDSPHTMRVIRVFAIRIGMIAVVGAAYFWIRTRI